MLAESCMDADVMQG